MYMRINVKMTLEMGIEELEAYGDSSLIIFQTRGKYKTKDPKLVPYHQFFTKLVDKFKDISFTYVLRMQNQFVDALTTLASMIKITEEVEI